MKITLTGKQVDISDRLRGRVEEAVENAVNKYFNAPISCSVAFSKDGEDFRAEVTVHPAKNIVLKGTGVAADPYSAFDNANEHIATRLRRQKTKLNDHKGKTGIALGFFHYPNKDFMLNFSMSSSSGEMMGGIGATWRFGKAKG